MLLVGRALRAVAAKLVQQLGLDLVFAHARLRLGAQAHRAIAHRARVGAGRNLRGAAHRRDLVRCPSRAASRPAAAPGRAALPGSRRRWRSRPRTASSQRVHPRLQGRVHAEREPHRGLVRQPIGQQAVECVDGKRVVDAQRGRAQRRGRGAGRPRSRVRGSCRGTAGCCARWRRSAARPRVRQTRSGSGSGCRAGTGDRRRCCAGVRARWARWQHRHPLRAASGPAAAALGTSLIFHRATLARSPRCCGFWSTLRAPRNTQRRSSPCNTVASAAAACRSASCRSAPGSRTTTRSTPRRPRDARRGDGRRHQFLRQRRGLCRAARAKS